MLLLVAGAVLVLGGLNACFDLSLGLGIGGTDIELMPDFAGNAGLSAILLAMAGLFEFLSDPKKVATWVKTHKPHAAAILTALVGGAYLGVMALVGGPLGMAVESNDVVKASALMGEGSYPSETLNPHLYQALRRGHLEMAEALIAGGADVNHLSVEEKTPLLASAVTFFPKAAVEFLLERKADPNHLDRYGRTPAMLLVLYRKSNVPQESDSERLALFQELVESRTDLSIEAADGKTLLDMAREQKVQAYVDYLESK
jgi:hypothetical protein